MITYRKAKLEDCKQVYDLIEENKELHTLEGTPPLWWIEEFVKNKRGIFVIAEEDKKLIGFNFGEELIGHGAMSHFVIVKKEKEGQGIGSELIEKFEKECKKRKLTWIITYSTSQRSGFIFNSQNYQKGDLMTEYLKEI